MLRIILIMFMSQSSFAFEFGRETERTLERTIQLVDRCLERAARLECESDGECLGETEACLVASGVRRPSELIYEYETKTKRPIY